MAAPRTNDELLELLRKSDLAPESRIHEFIVRAAALADPPGTPRRLAAALVAEGLITHLQAGLLLRGKWRNFHISGKYKLLEHIGTGGMGQVYLCEHVRMGRRVAIKVLPGEKSSDRISLHRFYREARAVAALNHPNIVRAHDIDHDGPLHFLVMEYVDGVNLQALVKRRGPLSVGRATDYIVKAACGLQHAHEAGLIHRDVKPSNVLLDRSGQIKLLDLGLARFFHEGGDQLTRNIPGRNVIGTADYLAPEQARDSHAADARSDIYGLGATFYFLLTGHGPFKEGNIAQKLLSHQSEKPTPVCELCPEVPEGLAAALDRMLEKSPDNRFQNCLELIDALNPFVPEHVPLPGEDEIPKLCPAAQSTEPPSGRIDAPERSGSKSRPAMTPVPKSAIIPRQKATSAWRPVLIAIALGLGSVLLGAAIGKLILAPWRGE